MKKCFLAALMLLGLSATALADGDNQVDVLYLDGSSHVVAMTEIDRITLGDGQVGVVTTDGQTTTHDMAKVDKIVLNSGTTGIGILQTAPKQQVLVRTDGYGFHVSGLNDGDQVRVYTAGGMLVGQAKAADGTAFVDGSQLANGVYVIKAGGRSLKMIKK